MTDRITEKIYAGLLGKNVGIRLGAPVEPGCWTPERIREVYGEITGYVKEYRNFAADDDANGPIFFVRALLDDAVGRPMTPQDVARAWLNYTRTGTGMFWWGGEGISTEHTAYLNLCRGVPAPHSGSIAQNGKTLAEQIGGQIFIDTFGLVCPGRPHAAADLGQTAASVSHDGNGLWGARFICAAIAAAFDCADPQQLVAAGLAELPPDCDYRRVVEAVCAFFAAYPDDWRACRTMLEREWGYDRWPGICHIIPNAGVCAMALLYSAGCFARGVEIAAMAGWDTDCNAGNVGTILGVAGGPGAIPAHYRAPIGDAIVCSSACGSLNIVDLPTMAVELALLARQLSGGPASQPHADGLRFDFALPGSTHGFRVSNPYFCTLAHSDAPDVAGGALRILYDALGGGQSCRIFYKPFYIRADFSDARYEPIFSPTASAGQTVSMQLYLDPWGGGAPVVCPCLRWADGRERLLTPVPLVPGRWQTLRFTLPDTGAALTEIGLLLTGSDAGRATGFLFLRSFEICGKAVYTVEMRRQFADFSPVIPFVTDGGSWALRENQLALDCSGPAFATTGSYYVRDCRLEVPVTRHTGDALLLCRAQGTRRFYAGGLTADGRAVLLRNNFGFAQLASCRFAAPAGQVVRLSLRCEGTQLTLAADGQPLLAVRDDAFGHGMVGCGADGPARISFGDFAVCAL